MRCPRCRTWYLRAKSCKPCQTITLLEAELRVARRALDTAGALLVAQATPFATAMLDALDSVYRTPAIMRTRSKPETEN